MRSSCCKTRPKTNSALALAVAPGGRAVLRARPLGFYYASRTGMTPASGVEALRVETARLLLESSESRGVVEVAQRAGFGDDERMRRAFMRHLGISPSEYRSRFAG